MNELVFIESKTQEPFTTSDIIAENTGVKNNSVTRLIQQHEDDFKEFGSLRFQIEVRKREVGATTHKYYVLNEQQATLLMTYLKNTDVVRIFKKELVRQFFAMREELMKRKIAASYRKPIRRSMTDEIKMLPDSENKKYMFSLYTDLAYKTSIGRTAKKIRKENNAPKKSNASQFMTADEIEKVTSRENQISTLLGLGLDYYEIKEILMKNNLEGKK